MKLNFTETFPVKTALAVKLSAVKLSFSKSPIAGKKIALQPTVLCYTYNNFLIPSPTPKRVLEGSSEKVHNNFSVVKRHIKIQTSKKAQTKVSQRLQEANWSKNFV